MVRRTGCAFVACVLGALAGPASAIAAGPPSIETEAAAQIRAADATLEARIDPNELETEYQFRVVPSPCHANPTNCSEVEPLFPATPGTIPAGSGGQAVSVDLKAAGMTLEPGTEYHYAVVAKNSEGTLAGPDQTFTTADLPSVLFETVTGVSTQFATLRAEIDPGFGSSAGARYQFQLAEDPTGLRPELTCPPEPASGPFLPCIGDHAQGVLPISFLPSGSPAGASLDLASVGVTLQPGTTYHYRVLVAPAVQTEDTIEWEAPAVAGPDQTFTTPIVSCPMTAFGPGPCPGGPAEPVGCLSTANFMSDGSSRCGAGPPVRPPCRRHRRHHRHHGHHGHRRHRHCHR